MDVTCWTVIRGAAEGRDEDIARFVNAYGPVVRAYLESRWRRGVLRDHVDDAMQDVFLACFDESGVLVRAQESRVQAFRPFLLGVVRNIARRVEAAQRKRLEREADVDSAFDVADPDGDEKRLSRVFDRAWAAAIIRETVAVQGERAKRMGAEAERRVELLRLRFGEGLKVRDIAARWGTDLKATHHDFDRARAEFRTALIEVMKFHYPGESRSVDKELERLMELIGG